MDDFSFFYLIGFFGSLSIFSAPVKFCTYQTWQWNIHSKKAMNHQTIKKNYQKLSPAEIHPGTGCTVCLEDQIQINIPGLPKFQICKKVSKAVKKALISSLTEGFPIGEIIGYRVGQTKGIPDSKGNRSLHSFHSYGVAIDINRSRNGLYTNCLSLGSQCQLIQGGAYHPSSIGSITKESSLYINFQKIGWKWGGEIAGRQKDFMHFSPSGY